MDEKSQQQQQQISHTNKRINNNFILFICPECTKTNNSEQIVGQDSKATQDALINARINYRPNETNRNTIKTHNINTIGVHF